MPDSCRASLSRRTAAPTPSSWSPRSTSGCRWLLSIVRMTCRASGRLISNRRLRCGGLHTADRGERGQPSFWFSSLGRRSKLAPASRLYRWREDLHSVPAYPQFRYCACPCCPRQRWRLVLQPERADGQLPNASDRYIGDRLLDRAELVVGVATSQKRVLIIRDDTR